MICTPAPASNLINAWDPSACGCPSSRSVKPVLILEGNITADDAVVFGISGGATSVSGQQTGAPSATAFQNYTVTGAVNQRSPVTTNTVAVSFPTAGAYAYGLDRGRGGDKNLALVMQPRCTPTTLAAGS